MYRFILFYFVLYICIYVAPWSCEARHLVPLYVHTCSGMTIKLNLNLNLNNDAIDRRAAHKAIDTVMVFLFIRHSVIQNILSSEM